LVNYAVSGFHNCVDRLLLREAVVCVKFSCLVAVQIYWVTSQRGGK